MIGLRSGTWHFTVEAPGYFTVETNAPVRVAAAPPMQFALAKDPGPIPNALDRNIQQLIEDAASMRDAGRLDQAIAAYQDIRSKNPKLTSINLVIGDLYRRKAAQETDRRRPPDSLPAGARRLRSDAQERRHQRARAGGERRHPRRHAQRVARTRRTIHRHAGPDPRTQLAVGRRRSSSRWCSPRRWAPRPWAGGMRASRRRTRGPSSARGGRPVQLRADGLRRAHERRAGDRRAGGRRRGVRARLHPLAGHAAGLHVAPHRTAAVRPRRP